MNLINFLKKNKYSRKIFGERELKIIEKQLIGTNLTQSEKNRLSRDIRKKFDFIKEVFNYSNQFDLRKGQETKEKIEEAKEVILEDVFFKKIKRMVLYGSFVTNELTFRSDIDIAVEFSDINVKEATLFRMRVLSKMDEKMDVQVYNILPDKIKKEIDLKGKVLYERKDI
ncbi:nucleotidyltransferase domain-containing protein [Candidatus Woesearchaeota archaeon]|nr:nucleotidyltransferase domain-containing protein [Candidatus Woesearchaeota archaeon]